MLLWHSMIIPLDSRSHLALPMIRGSVRFENIAATGALRVSVPYLNYSQIVFGGESNILIRVAPQQLPGTIP